MIHSFKLISTKEKLLQKISFFGKKKVEAGQVSSRLRKLLPERLSELKKQHQNSQISASKASRKALCDEAYRDHVLEYVSLKEQALSSRIQWETHRMYFYAKKTRS